MVYYVAMTDPDRVKMGGPSKTSIVSICPRSLVRVDIGRRKEERKKVREEEKSKEGRKD